jgi:hypothetical protein
VSGDLIARGNRAAAREPAVDIVVRSIVEVKERRSWRRWMW